jgi:hypothetical protein
VLGWIIAIIIVIAMIVYLIVRTGIGISSGPPTGGRLYRGDGLTILYFWRLISRPRRRVGAFG